MNFFFAYGTDLPTLDYAYSGWLVALSFLVATFGSALALYIASSVGKAESKRTQRLLMAIGSVAFGASVWSMHFIGMLAFSLCAVVTYNMTITLLSVLPAIAAAWVVLHWVSKFDRSPSYFLLGGLLTGAGIGLMHYSGMYAMQMNALLRFEHKAFGFSIIAAVTLATLSLWSRSYLLAAKSITNRYANTLSAIIMGMAITMMHYLGMAAARFIGQPESVAPIPPADWFYLSLLVFIGITTILGYVASGVLYSRLKNALSSLNTALSDLKTHDLELQTIIQNSTEAIITASHDGTLKNANKTFGALFGYMENSIHGEHISTFLPEWSLLLYNGERNSPLETLGKRQNGDEFPIKISLAEITTDTTALYVGFLTDLTEVKQEQARLIEDANKDFLTNLWNRRYLFNQLELEITRSARSESDFSVVMLDIDHFKRINDTFGHTTGDVVLKHMAAEIKAKSRGGDVLARYGGEEFVALLPNTSQSVAEAVANRLRECIAKLVVNTEDGQLVVFTVSAGITTSRSRTSLTPHQLIAEADAALYEAKNTGRNRVVVYRCENT